MTDDKLRKAMDEMVSIFSGCNAYPGRLGRGVYNVKYGSYVYVLSNGIYFKAPRDFGVSEHAADSDMEKEIHFIDAKFFTAKGKDMAKVVPFPRNRGLRALMHVVNKETGDHLLYVAKEYCTEAMEFTRYGEGKREFWADESVLLIVRGEFRACVVGYYFE